LPYSKQFYPKKLFSYLLEIILFDINHKYLIIRDRVEIINKTELKPIAHSNTKPLGKYPLSNALKLANNNQYFNFGPTTCFQLTIPISLNTGDKKCLKKDLTNALVL